MNSVTFHVDFIADHVMGFARLDKEIPFAPTVDIGFEHPVWHETHKPTSVSYNLEDGSFYVTFADEKFPSKEEVTKRADMYRGHGWTVSKGLLKE